MKVYSLTVLSLLAACMVGCDDELTGPTSSPPLWPQSTPQEQAMDKPLLDSAFARAESAGFVDGMLVIRNGYLVAEDYFNGFDSARPHNVMSVSKSFLSVATGLAVEQGYIESLDERVIDYFPEYVYPGMEPSKYLITVRHLLTMRMGIPGEADDAYAEYWRLYNSDNWIKATIETPLEFEPGERMAYNTFSTHLLSGIITRTCGMSAHAFMSRMLLTPMGIDVDDWERDPQGYYFGGNSMYFTPREMAVLGWLYLKRGKLDGRQIVPESWVELTLTPSTDLTHPNEWGALKNYNYAYLWWLGEIGGEGAFMGYGYGGQFVIAFPALNMVVVTTSRHEVDPDTSTDQEWFLFDLVARYVVPSAN